jgi:heme exporter protein D
MFWTLLFVGYAVFGTALAIITYLIVKLETRKQAILRRLARRAHRTESANSSIGMIAA